LLVAAYSALSRGFVAGGEVESFESLKINPPKPGEVSEKNKEVWVNGITVGQKRSNRHDEVTERSQSESQRL